MKKLTFLLLSIVLAASACKKDDKKSDDPNTTTPTDTTNKYVSKYTAMITDRWQINAVYIMSKDLKDTIYDYYSAMKNCEKDNFIQFSAAKTVSVDEGAEKCDPSAAQITTDGNWNLNSDTTVLTISDSKILPISGTIIARVENLNYSNLKISKDTNITIPGIPPVPGVIFANFKKVK